MVILRFIGNAGRLFRSASLIFPLTADNPDSPEKEHILYYIERKGVQPPELSMLKKYLEIGKIVSTHGIRGEVRVDPWCDSPDFFKRFKTLWFDKNGEKPVKVLSCRPHGNIVILALEGTDSIDKANLLRNKILYMDRDDAQLPENKYFIQDLIGCSVVDADNEAKVYGKLCDVSETGANDVWHVKDEKGREYLLPAIPPVVIETDVENEIIKIRPLRGIFDDED